MTLPGADESLLRRYLLGSVTDAARKELEARLFSDDRIFWERISIAEDELVSDYVQNALTGEERQDFEKHFLCTDERRSKVEFASALHAHARAARASAQEQRESGWAWLRRPFLSPAWAMAAAALLIVILQLPRPDSGAANDQEIETAVPLTADRTRDAGELTRVRIDSNSRIVRLVIPEELERFPEYRASLYRVEDDLRIAELNLPADWIQKGRNLPFPTELLPAGDYYVRMTGLPAGASAVPLKRYDFRVSRD